MGATCQRGGAITEGHDSKVFVRQKKKSPTSNRKESSTVPSPYPALYIQPSRGDIALSNSRPQSRPPAEPSSTTAAANKLRTSFDSAPIAIRTTSSSTYSVGLGQLLLPMRSQTPQAGATAKPPKPPATYPTEGEDNESFSDEYDDVAFVRTYDLFPRQWAYLEHYASVQREKEDSGNYHAEALEGEDSDPYGLFFDYNFGDAVTVTSRLTNKLLTPTQSFVWQELVNTILDDEEKKERIDAAHSVGQSMGRSKMTIHTSGLGAVTLPTAFPKRKTDFPKMLNPLNAPAVVPPLTSTHVKLSAHGVPQPQPNLEDPRPDRATRRERMAAHKAARNYTKICGYTLESVSRWVDSPRDIDL